MRKSEQLYKADLHVHSRHSGRVKHLRFLRARDCYSSPLDVYRRAKRRGMDLVTITDHDAIDGCLEVMEKLGSPADFMMGEEVTAYLPRFRHTIHIGVYGHTEPQHHEIQRLRADGEELVAYLRQHNLLFALNHFFHDFENFARTREFIERMAQLFEVFEVRNGAMQREHNSFIVSLLDRYRTSGRPLGFVAGSDSHTLRRVGRTYTASAARTREEFIADIRAGRTQVFGPHSNHLSLARDIYGVVLRYYPAVLSVGNGEFSPRTRIKNVFLSILAAPFLVTPYIMALRYTILERARVSRCSRLLTES